jgi:hypothetical protein
VGGVDEPVEEASAKRTSTVSRGSRYGTEE